MSGHSKWATIKRKKAATDAARGKAFTRVIKEITIAARQAGADPDANPRLRTAILAAKAVNMPAGNIDRAIKKGSGELGGAAIEEAHYEGYAPGGVALLIEVATDNRNRTSGDVRNLLTRFGGAMAEAGSVSYLFKPRGVITVDKAAISEEALIDIVLEAGADDVGAEGETFEVTTPPARFEAVKEALAAKKVAVQGAEITKIASLQVPVSEKDAGSVIRLVEALEDHDDVQKVYANFSIPDDVLVRLAH